MPRKLTLIWFSVICCLPHVLFALTPINTEDHPKARIEMNELVYDHAITKTELRKLKSDEKHLVRFEHFYSSFTKKSTASSSKHAAGIFSDPVNRWFWLWVITWGIGIFLLVVSSGALAGAGIGLLWFLAFGLGSIALIIWLVKKFGA